MLTAKAWKDFYQEERQSLGREGLISLIDQAPKIVAPAIIFPHTRLRASGHLIAAAAKAVVESRCEVVLALGVLHGRDRGNQRLRAIHGTEVEAEEFSLDNFLALVELAAQRAGRKAPRVERRYPFLTGESPASMDGFIELPTLIRDGAMLVATTDPIHHGAGYETPPDERLARENPRTRDIARAWINDQLTALQRRDYPSFLAHANAVRSDFRDVGPVLAALVPDSRFEIHALELVDYADVLNAPQPTWVAAALITSPASPATLPRAWPSSS